MKHPFLICVLALTISSCTEFSTMYRVGNTKTQTNVDQAQCNRYAADRYPPNIITDWWPVYASDGTFLGNRIERTDINEGPRHTAARNCMFDQGYERVKIPYCKDEQIAGRSFAPITTAPPLGPNICGIRQQGGGRVIIDLSKPI